MPLEPLEYNPFEDDDSEISSDLIELDGNPFENDTTTPASGNAASSRLEELDFNPFEDAGAAAQTAAPAEDSAFPRLSFQDQSFVDRNFADPLETGGRNLAVAGRAIVASGHAEKLRLMAQIDEHRAAGNEKGLSVLMQRAGRNPEISMYAQASEDIRAKMRGKYEKDIVRQFKGIAGQQEAIAKLPQDPGLQEISEAKTFGEAAQAAWDNPASIARVAMQSLPLMAPGIALSAVAGPALGFGAGSFMAEHGLSLIQTLQEIGVDVTDEKAIAEAFLDPEVLTIARERANARGLPIAFLDMISAGIAGKMIAPAVIGGRTLSPAAREAANVVAQMPVQAVAGATGETLAGLAADGELKPGEILLEGLAEGPTAVVEVPVAAALVGRKTGSAIPGQPRGDRARMPIPQLNDGDRASVIPDETISAGKAIIADALAQKGANEKLDGATLPPIGTPVVIQHPDGLVQTGIVEDAFTESVDSLNIEDTGVTVRLEDGTEFEALSSELSRGGVTISPISVPDPEATRAGEEATAPAGIPVPADVVASPPAEGSIPSTPEPAAPTDMMAPKPTVPPAPADPKIKTPDIGPVTEAQTALVKEGVDDPEGYPVGVRLERTDRGYKIVETAEFFEAPKLTEIGTAANGIFMNDLILNSEGDFVAAQTIIRGGTGANDPRTTAFQANNAEHLQQVLNDLAELLYAQKMSDPSAVAMSDAFDESIIASGMGMPTVQTDPKVTEAQKAAEIEAETDAANQNDDGPQPPVNEDGEVELSVEQGAEIEADQRRADLAVFADISSKGPVNAQIGIKGEAFPIDSYEDLRARWENTVNASGAPESERQNVLITNASNVVVGHITRDGEFRKGRPFVQEQSGNAEGFEKSKQTHLKTWMNKDFKRIFKSVSGDVDRTSSVAFKMTQGYRDGVDGKPFNRSNYGFSEGQIQPYLQGYQAALSERDEPGSADVSKWLRGNNAQIIYDGIISEEEGAADNSNNLFGQEDNKTDSAVPEAGENTKFRGEKVDGEWVEFAKDSGSLGIPRDSMPQVKAEHRGALANFLKARDIDGTEETVQADSLKPTQAEFSEKKVAKAKSFEGGDRAILVSKDGHIVDGHHQWMAKVDEGAEIRIIRLDAPIVDLLNQVAEFPSADQDGNLPAPSTKTRDLIEKVNAEKAGNSGPRVFINKVGRDGKTDAERGGEIHPKAGTKMEDWSNTVIPHPDEGGVDGDNDGGPTKNRFLADGRKFARAIAEIMIADGFEPGPSKKKGKLGNSVRINEGGIAVSGDVYLELYRPDQSGVYMQIGAALSGPNGGISIVARSVTRNSGVSRGGPNRWLSVDMTAGEMARELTDITEAGLFMAARKADRSAREGIIDYIAGKLPDGYTVTDYAGAPASIFSIEKGGEIGKVTARVKTNEHADQLLAKLGLGDKSPVVGTLDAPIAKPDGDIVYGPWKEFGAGYKGRSRTDTAGNVVQTIHMPSGTIVTRGTNGPGSRRAGEPYWEVESGEFPTKAVLEKAFAELDALKGTNQEPKPQDSAAPMGIPAPESKPDQEPGYGGENKIFTQSAAEKAREALRKKLGNISSGVDPEIMMHGITLAGYHIEAGARSFAKYSAAMVGDLGEGIRPYLKSFYEAARNWPGMDTTGMTPANEITETETDDGIQNAVPASDAGASPTDVQGTEDIGEDGSTPAGENGGSVPDAGRPDSERTEGGKRPGKTASPAGSGTSGNSSPDRVSAGRKGKRDSVKGKNYTIEPGALDESRGPKAKATGNIRAIELMREIEAEGRNATHGEQRELALYVGWGGIKGAFPDADGNFGKGFEEIGAQLQSMLSDTEYRTAQRSIQYAHYTSETIVRSMWAAVERLGFKGGKVFEPGMGSGNFIGMAPETVAARVDYSGLELDHTTARIARLLYPQSGIRQDDFTRSPLPTDTYDMVIGNPPFADISIQTDPKYPQKFLLHDYFFAKSLDAVRPGGLLAFITSAGTMNKLDSEAREYLAERADLVAAIRLPDTAFAGNAGTSVTTDIIFLRKKDPDAPFEAAVPADKWTQTRSVSLPNKEGTETLGNSNQYFNDNPDRILGEQGFFDKLYLGRYAVRGQKGVSLEGPIQKQIDTFPIDIMSDWKDTTGRAEADFGTTEQKEGSYYVHTDGELYQMESGVGRKLQRRGKGVKGGKTKGEMDRIRALIPIRDALRAVYAADLGKDTANATAARKRLNSEYDAFVKKNGPINKLEVKFRGPTVIQQEGARSTAREEARYIGDIFEEGSFDPSRLIAAGEKNTAIAKARKEAREEAEARNAPWDEGTFNPEDMTDTAIEKRENIDPFFGDQEYYRLRAIEDFDESTGEATKGEVFLRNIVSQEREPEINSLNDAVLYVLNKFGRFDITEIAHTFGITAEQAIEELGDRIFKVPGQGETWATSDEYLSGDVRKKLTEARDLSEKDLSFRRNVSALEAVQPTALAPSDIAASLGMPWIPPATIEQFGTEALGLTSLKIKYLPALALWSVSGDKTSAAARSTWGTTDHAAPALILYALNRQDPKVSREYTKPDGSKGTETDTVATEAALAKQKDIRERFNDWIWEDATRADELAERYNDEYNNIVSRIYDGGYLTTPGVTSSWSWRPHQTRVIARIIQSGNTYMGHAVGAGKTSAMIGAGMEMRRLGLARKPMYAVPNHMLGQFTKEFYEQYPTAKIMVADEKAFHTDRRKQFIANAANADLDAVIIPHSSFGLIPMSNEFEDGLVQKQIDEYRAVLEEMGKDQETRITRGKLESQIERFEQRLSGNASNNKDQVFTFEEMGVDFLFVDEGHLFRKLDFSTKMSNVKGVSPIGAKMSWDLYVKTRYLETINPGRNLVMASGTPITNTMAELFTVQRYMQPEQLADRGLNHFDAWAGAFGDTVTNTEQDATGGYKQVTRFAKFVNIPELSSIVRESMDVVTSKQLAQYVTRPTIRGGKRDMNLAEKSQHLEDYQAHLTRRMEAIAARKGPPQPGDDIILSVINDGRHAAIDMRLVDPDVKTNMPSKLEIATTNVFKQWEATKLQPLYGVKPEGGYTDEPVDRGPGTQMVFANLGVGTSRAFRVHEYMRSELIRQGVPRDQIALISEHKSHVAKQRLFNDMNEGKVRILIGSTAKMGTGVNAQRRLTDIHNMDPLWFPSDDEQRNGRGIRQGNMNREIGIHDYATKGTYDSTMWGMMETKARFIEGFFAGDPNLRDMDDLGEASQFEQAKAMSTADPRLIELTDKRQELEKLVRREKGHQREQHAIRGRISEAGRNVERAERRIEAITGDIAKRTDTTGKNFTAEAAGETFTDRVEFGAAILKALDDKIILPLKSGDKKVTLDTLATIGGFDVVAEGWMIGILGQQEAQYSVYLEMTGDGAQANVKISGSSSGVTQSIEGALKGFESRLELQQFDLSKAQTTLEQYADFEETKYPDRGQIDTLYEEVEALDAAILGDIKKDEAPSVAQVNVDEDGRISTEDDEDGDGPDKGILSWQRQDDIVDVNDEVSGLLTEKWDSAKEKIRDAIYAAVKKRAPGLKVDVYERLLAVVEGKPFKIGGVYYRNENSAGVIEHLAAVSMNSAAPYGTVTHEIIHFLRQSGAIRPAEWEILAAAADPWMAKFDIKAKYPELSADKQIEEAVAEAYGAMSDDEFKASTPTSRVFRSIQMFFQRIRGIVGRQGFKTAEEIFGAIDAGIIGRRTGNTPLADAAPVSFQRKKGAKAHGITFDNPDTEKRWKRARLGVGAGDSLALRVKARIGHIAQGLSSHFGGEIFIDGHKETVFLPNTPEWADAMQQLRKFSASPQATKEEVIRHVYSVVDGMNKDDLDLFTRKVVLDDLQWEADQNHEIPFGLDAETLKVERAKIEEVLRDRPDIRSAIRRRRLINSDIARRLVEAGVLSKSQIKNPNYYRHTVLEYARGVMRMPATKTGQRVKQPYWARRMGSTLDINANLLEAEFEWMQKALSGITEAKTIDWLKKSKHNVRDAVLAKAKAENDKNLKNLLDMDMKENGYTTGSGRQTSPINEIFMEFRKSIAIGMQKISGAVGNMQDIPAEFEKIANSLEAGLADNEGKLFPFLSWIMDNDQPGAMGAGMVFKAITGRKEIVRQMLGERYMDPSDVTSAVKKFAPDGYTIWQPEPGKHMFVSKTISEHVVDKFMQHLEQGQDIPAEMAALMSAGMRSQVKEQLAVGGEKYQLVVPIELAATLNGLGDTYSGNIVNFLFDSPLRQWKRWVLINPRRVLKYNLNNISGDLDAVLAGNPRIVKHFGRASKELYAVMRQKKAPSDLYMQAVERGVFDSGLTAQEIPDINHLSQFAHLDGTRGPINKVTIGSLGKVWRTLQGATQWRENILRYAAYIEYTNQLNAGKTMAEIGYGASVPKMIDAVPDLKDKAALAARDMVGDYGAISYYGAGLRRHFIPFWSWLEINTKRYWRLTSNAFGQGVGKGLAVGGGLAVSAGARKTAWLMLRMSMLYITVQVWNNLLMGDLEDELSEDDKARMHVVLPFRDADGRVLTVRFQGAFSDALSLIGLSDIAGGISAVESGKATAYESAKALGRAPVNRVVTGLTPVIMAPVELAFGVKVWPDVFEPRSVRDRWRNLAQLFSIEHEYDQAIGAPTRGYGQSLVNTVVNTRDPGETAYNEMKGLAHDWVRETKGSTGSSNFSTPSSDALYKWRKARKFGDEKAEASALETMEELGMGTERIGRSIKRAHPLGGVAIKDRGAFLESLTDDQMDKLDVAKDWYQDVFAR